MLWLLIQVIVDTTKSPVGHKNWVLLTGCSDQPGFQLKNDGTCLSGQNKQVLK